jgi:signal peptidase I
MDYLPTDEQQITQASPSSNDIDALAEELKPKLKSAKSFWLDALETIAIALVIFFVIYNFIAQPHLVKGESMMPNYHDGEYILTSKIYNWWGNARRGDVVVLKSPDDKSVQFIKRIIGLPGEKFKIDNNQITIYNQQFPNGFVLDEKYIDDQIITEGRTFIPEGEIISIPKDNYVVMGDNRNYSYDSRAWGFLNKTDLVGRAFFVYWPIVDFGLVAHASYK